MYILWPIRFKHSTWLLGEQRVTCTLPYPSTGGSVGPGEKEDEEARRSLFHADVSDRSCSQEAASCWSEYLCSRRPGTHRPRQEPLYPGTANTHWNTHTHTYNVYSQSNMLDYSISDTLWKNVTVAVMVKLYECINSCRCYYFSVNIIHYFVINI